MLSVVRSAVCYSYQQPINTWTNPSTRRTAHAHSKPEIAAWETSLSVSASSELSVVTIQASQKQGNTVQAIQSIRTGSNTLSRPTKSSLSKCLTQDLMNNEKKERDFLGLVQNTDFFQNRREKSDLIYSKAIFHCYSWTHYVKGLSSQSHVLAIQLGPPPQNRFRCQI